MASFGPVTIPATTPRVDVAVSMEVGHQLPPDVAGPYVALLCRLAGVVVFSSSQPGGFDLLPLNERPRDYWVAMFDGHGFEFDEPTTTTLQGAWQKQKTTRWFYKNLMVFRTASPPEPGREA